ncbi:hypothetical protein BJ982_006253 [Sphaerisporangium siamense]|uniref:Uncharacterized protein n=1 Tax=Sphaerisporangium siamense TaxID=795645 RepID=A0A7W7GDN3_9ACTN|nr:hypothetical protein [Sphaerisporangium siamense]
MIHGRSSGGRAEVHDRYRDAPGARRAAHGAPRGAGGL